MRPTLLFALALPLIVACRGRESDPHTSGGADQAKTVEAPIPAGETMRISTKDRVFDLALRNDSVVLSLSGHAFGEVQKALDSAAADDGKNTLVGSFVARTLKSGAEKLAAKTTGFPLRELETVTYESGRLDFQLKGGKQPFIPFDHVKEGGHSVLEAFPPVDAERFVQAVRTAKSSG
jgi:hypothetical protein